MWPVPVPDQHSSDIQSALAKRGAMKTNARDIIVVGTSAGGVEALCRLVSALPRDFRAALFIVMHVPGWRNSFLPSILSRCTPLTTVHATAHNSIERGHIYIAPPDQHLVFNSGDHTELWHGPKENNFRPSIDVLFRSAAVTFGPRVTGVILTGTLEDGAAGLWWIKRMGGATIVQDPAEAEFADMPRTALLHVAVDHVARLSEMPAILDRLARTNPEAVEELGEGLPE
jgi:two-component system chemotaxis response regulator CheB